MSLEGRHALVTGGGRGIGRAVALSLVAAGARVTITGRTEASLQEAVAAGVAQAYGLADASDAAATARAFEAAEANHGPIDILVANAGSAETAPFLKSDADLFQRMFDANVLSVVHAARAVLPGMVARRHGRIIAIASTAGVKGYAYVSAYVAAKHAVVGLTKALALETATAGVTVNAVCPGYTETDMVREGLARITAKTGKGADEALAVMLKDSPLKRLIRPEEVAAACVWLASDAAAAVTGTTVMVAGGEV